VIVAGVECKAHYFAVDLPQSDDCFVAVFPAETTEAFLEGHVRALQASSHRSIREDWLCAVRVARAARLGITPEALCERFKADSQGVKARIGRLWRRRSEFGQVVATSGGLAAFEARSRLVIRDRH
jgi:hypothetical protein